MTNHTKEADKVLSLLKEINRATDTRFFLAAHEVMHMDLRIKELEEQVDMADRKLLQMENRLIGMSLKLPLHEFNRLTAEELITTPLGAKVSPPDGYTKTEWFKHCRQMFDEAEED